MRNIFCSAVLAVLVLAGNLLAQRNMNLDRAKRQVFGLAGNRANQARQAEEAVESGVQAVRSADAPNPADEEQQWEPQAAGKPLLGKIVGIEFAFSHGYDDPAVVVPVQKLLASYGAMVTARPTMRSSGWNQMKCDGMAVDICVQIGRTEVPRQEERHVNRDGNTRIKGQNIRYGGGHRAVRSEAYVQVQFWGFRGNAPLLYAAEEADGTVKSGSTRYDVRTSGHNVNLGQSGGGSVRSDPRFLGYRIAVAKAIHAAVATYAEQRRTLEGR